MTTMRLGGRSDTNPLPTAHTAGSGRGSRQGNPPPYHSSHSRLPPPSAPLSVNELMEMTEYDARSQYRTEMPYSPDFSAQRGGYSGHTVTEEKRRWQAQNYYRYQAQQGVRYAPARADIPVYGARAHEAGYGSGVGQDAALNSCQQSESYVSQMYQSVPAGSVRRDHLQIPVEQPSSYSQPESFPPCRQMTAEQLEHMDRRLRQAAWTQQRYEMKTQQQGPRSLPHSAQSLSQKRRHFQPQAFHVQPSSSQRNNYVQGNPSQVHSQCCEYSNVQSHGQKRASEPTSFQYNHASPCQATQAASRQCSHYSQAYAYTDPSNACAVPTPSYSYDREPALLRPAQHHSGHSSITSNHHHQPGQGFFFFFFGVPEGLAGHAVAELPNTAHVPYQHAQGVQQDGIHAGSAEDRRYLVHHDASSSGYQTAALGVSRVVSRPEITNSICENLLRSKGKSLQTLSEDNPAHKPQEQLDTVPASQAAVQPLAPFLTVSGSQPHSRVSSDCTQAVVQPLAPSRTVSSSQPHPRVSSDCTQKQPAQQGDASDRKDRSLWDSIQVSLGVARAGSESECSNSNVDTFSTFESQQTSSSVYPVSVSRGDGMELFSASDSVSRFPPVPPLVHCSMIHSPNSSSVSHCHHASSSSSLASAVKQTHSDSSSVDNITESPTTLSSLRCEAQSQSSGKSPACAVKKEANMEVDPTQFDKLRLKMKTFLATIGTDLSPTKSRQSSGSTCTHNSRSCEHQDSQSSRGSLPPPDPDTEDRNLESGVLMIEHNDSVLDELLESDVDNMKKMYLGSSGTGTSQELETDSRHTGAEESVRENRIETSLANTDPCDSNFNCELFSDETRTNIVITMDKAPVDGATTQKNETFETVSTKISNDEDKMRNHDSLVDITHTCLTCRKHFALSDLLEEHLLEHTESQVDDLQTPADTASLCDTVSQEINLEPNLDSNKRDDKSMVVKMEFSKRVPTKEKILTFVDRRAKRLSCSTDSVDNEKLFDNHCEQVSSHDTFLPKALKTNPGSSTQAVCSILKHSSSPSAAVSLDSPAHCASSVKSRQEHVPEPLIVKTSPNRTKSQDSSAVTKQVPEKAAGLKSNQHDSAKSVSKTCHQDALKNPLSKLSSKDTNRSSSSNSEKQHGSHSRLAKSSNVNSQTSTTEKLPQDISKPTTPKPSGNHTNRQDSSTPKTHVQEKQTSSSRKTSRSAKSENNSDAAKPIDKDSHARKSPKFGDDSCWKVLSNGQIFRVGSRRKSIESCDYSQCFIEEMRNADYEASSSPKETVPVSKYTPQVRLATQTGDRSESVDDSGSVPKGGDNGLAPRDKTVQEAKTKPLTASDTKVKSETCRIDRKCEVGAKASSVKKSVSVDSAPSAKHTCDRDADVGTKAGVKTVQVVKTKPHTASHSKSETPRSNGKAEVEAKPGGVKKSVSIDSAPSAKETCESTESSRGLKRSHSEIVDHKDHDASQAKPRKHTYSVPKELPKKNHKRGSDIGMASRDKHVLEVIDKTKPQTASNTTVKSETCRNNRNSEVGAKPGGVKKSVSVDYAPSVKKTCVELEGSRNLKRSHSETVDHKDPDAYKTKARKHTDTANGKSVPNEQPKKNHKNCEMSSKKHFKDSERSSSNCAKSAEKHDLISDGSSHRQLSSSRTERSGSSGKSGESKKYCIGDTDQKRHLSADDCSNSSKSNAKKLKTDVSNDSSSSQHGVPVSSDGSSSTKRRHKSALQSEIERKVCDLARVVLEKRSARTLTLSVESQPEDRAVFKRSNKTEDKATAEQHYSKKRANSYDHDSSRNSSKKKQSNSGEGSQAADDSASIEQKTSSSKDTVGSKGSTSLREKSTANKITPFSSTDSDKPSSKPPARKYRSAKAVALERSAAKTNLEKTPPHVKDDSNVSKFSTEKHVTEMDTHSDTYISSQKIRPVVDKSSSSDKVVERRRPDVKPILGPIAIDNDVCFEFCTNCQTIFTSRVKYGQHTCVTLTWDSTEDDSNNSDAGKDAGLVLKGKSRKNRDGEDNTKGESNNTASKSESNGGDGNVETCRPDNHRRKSTEGRLTSLHESSKTGSDKSSKTGSDKSSKTGSDKSSKTGSDKSRKTGNDKSSKTGSDKSRKTGNDKSSKTGSDKSSKTGSDKSSKTGNDKSSKTGSDKSSKTGNDKSSKTGSDKSSKTGSDKSSKTGSDKSSKTGSDKSSKTGSDKSSKTGNDKSSKTGNDKSSKTGSDKSSKTGNDKSSKTGNDKSSKTGSDKSSKTGSDKHNSGKTRDTSEKPNDNSEKTTHNSGKTRDSSEKPNDSEIRHNSGKTRDSSEKPNDNSEKTTHNSGKTRDSSEKPNDSSETRHNSGKTRDSSEKPNDNSEKRKDESRKSKDTSGKTADKSEKKKDISGKTNDKSCGRASKSQCNEDNDLKSHRQSSATSPSDGKERTKDNSRERSSKTDQQMFSCEKCNEKYSSRGGLLHHLRNYHMKK